MLPISTIFKIYKEVFQDNMLQLPLQSINPALAVHTFCSIDLHPFDLKRISLHLHPFTASESSAALTGAGFTILWECCIYLFIFVSARGLSTHDKAMKYDIDTEKRVFLQIGRIQNKQKHSDGRGLLAVTPATEM